MYSFVKVMKMRKILSNSWCCALKHHRDTKLPSLLDQLFFLRKSLASFNSPKSFRVCVMKELVCCVSRTRGTNILIFLMGCFSRNSSRLNTTSVFTSTTATGGRNGFFRWVKTSENNSPTSSPDSRITETQTGSLHLAAGMCNTFDLAHTNMIGWQIYWI